MADWDVVVVGAGNAALCAALAARESGASVLVLERSSEDEGGGNTRFTAGAIRTVYNGVDDLRALMPDLTDDEVAITDFGTYTSDQFFDEIFRVTQYRCDPDMAETLITRSYETLRSEEHTSELQSLMRISYAVFCLKKKNKKTTIHINKEQSEHK